MTDCLQNTSVNRQVQLNEFHYTELEAGTSFYRILASIKPLSPARTVSYLASQNGFTNILSFLFSLLVTYYQVISGCNRINLARHN